MMYHLEERRKKKEERGKRKEERGG